MTELSEETKKLLDEQKNQFAEQAKNDREASVKLFQDMFKMRDEAEEKRAEAARTQAATDRAAAEAAHKAEIDKVRAEAKAELDKAKADFKTETDDLKLR